MTRLLTSSELAEVLHRAVRRKRRDGQLFAVLLVVLTPALLFLTLFGVLVGAAWVGFPLRVVVRAGGGHGADYLPPSSLNLSSALGLSL